MKGIIIAVAVIVVGLVAMNVVWKDDINHFFDTATLGPPRGE